MTHLKVSIPVYKKDSWHTLEKDGKIEVSSDVDNLADGYEDLKNQIDELLHKLDAQSRLADSARSLDDQIEQKAFTLKNILKDIERATEHYENLRLFLQNLGVDPVAQRLTFDKRFLPQEVSIVEIEAAKNYCDGEF